MIDSVVRWVRRRLPVKDKFKRKDWQSQMKTRIDESENSIRKIQYETDRLRQGNFMEQELLERRRE